MVQAASAGLLAAQALPPRHWWALLPLAAGWLLWLLEQHLGAMPAAAGRARRAAALLFAWGLGWHGWGIYWVAEAFFVDAARYAALAPFAVALLAVAMSAFYAATGAVMGWAWRNRAAACLWHAPMLVAAIVVADVLRGQPAAFGGFPWNPLASVLDAGWMLPLMQGAHLLGVWGFSALLLWLALVPAQALWCARSARVRAAGLLLGGAGLLLAMLWLWGQGRVQRIAAMPADAAAPWIVVVQPSVPQREKWQEDNRARIFEDLLALSRRGLARVRERCRRDGSCAAPVVVVWPESAVPFLLDASPRALAMIAAMLPPGGWLLTGALRQVDPARRRADGPRLHNSILAIDSDGRLRLTYDKRRLVPFGEYVPLATLLQPLGVRHLVPFRHGFAPGTDMGPHRLPRLPPFEAFICYEVIYHDRPPAAAATRWLLNVTNDAWFGTSAGPYQHLAAARYHAIVRGLPLVRAANSGISAIFDGAGRLLARLPLEVRDVLVMRLPLPAAP